MSEKHSFSPSPPGTPNYQPPSTPLFRLLPTSWIPYAELMRLDRPAGFYAFFWHYAIGLSLAACLTTTSTASSSLSSPPSPTTLLTLTSFLSLWTIIFRGAVCAWNDNLDQDFDRMVARCRFRPIARGAVSTFQGHVFTAGLMVLAAGMLAVGLPNGWVVMGYAAVMTFILGIYPLGKRYTDFPQVILGFGLAIPVGMCCAIFGRDPIAGGRRTGMEERLGVAAMYVANGIWTVTFDTVYAHQDKRDDVKAGVKSLAVRLGERTKLALGLLSAVQVGLLVATGVLCGLHPVYFVVACGGAAAALAAMLVLVNLEQPASCAWWFGPGSRIVGASVVVGLLGHYLTTLQMSLIF